LEQEKLGLQRKLKGRGVTADQVVGARTLEADRETEELHKRNVELEQQIKVIKCVPNHAPLYQSSMCNLSICLMNV